ncbi:hypothetical protein Tco_1488355, partial [Tanacetum coccineum]
SQAVNKSPTHYPCDSGRTFRVILFSIHSDNGNPSSINIKQHWGRSVLTEPRRQCSSLTPAESNSLPHAQASKTSYKHQDSRIKKAKVQTKTKTSATLIFKIFLKDIKIIKTKIVKEDC